MKVIKTIGVVVLAVVFSPAITVGVLLEGAYLAYLFGRGLAQAIMEKI